jgi:hypothetical protein
MSEQAEVMTTAEVAAYWQCDRRKVAQTLGRHGLTPVGTQPTGHGGATTLWDANQVRALREQLQAGPGNRTRGDQRRGGRRQTGRRWSTPCHARRAPRPQPHLPDWQHAMSTDPQDIPTHTDADADADAQYLVWSNQHGAWWRPNRRGYTSAIEEAGRYTLDEAQRIVANATLDGRLVRERTDPITGTAYTCLDEVAVLAPAAGQPHQGDEPR